MEEIIIRKPSAKDQIQINNLAKQVHKLHVNWNPDLFLDIDEVIPLERLQKLLDSNSIYVACFEDNIVGYIILDILIKDNGFMRYRKLLSIDTLCVDEKFRRKGIGTKLMDFAKNYANENNCTDLYLTVDPNNKEAINAYEKYGMKQHNISYMLKLCQRGRSLLT